MNMYKYEYNILYNKIFQNELYLFDINIYELTTKINDLFKYIIKHKYQYISKYYFLK